MGDSLDIKDLKIQPPARAFSPSEQALREGFLQFLPRLAKAHLLVLRAASSSLGCDFGEDEWEAFAREYDLPVSSTFARSSGGGSFNFAKFLAGAGPLPPHPGGPRFRASEKTRGWDTERLLLGAMTLARMNGGWPSRERFDEMARKARARGVDVPLFDTLQRRLGLTYTEIKQAAQELVDALAGSSPSEGVPPNYDRADAVASGMALGVEFLGYRPSSETWTGETREYRGRGVPGIRTIMRTFGAWHRGWAHVEQLGLDPGVQKRVRPRYTLTQIVRGMSIVEEELGRRPNAHEWKNEVRELKRKYGAGVIPAKPTIYARFDSWTKAWEYVDILRAHGSI